MSIYSIFRFCNSMYNILCLTYDNLGVQNMVGAIRRNVIYIYLSGVVYIVLVYRGYHDICSCIPSFSPVHRERIDDESDSREPTLTTTHIASLKKKIQAISINFNKILNFASMINHNYFYLFCAN